MARSSLDVHFMDLTILDLIFIFLFLEVIINLRSWSKKNYGNFLIWFVSLYFKQLFDNYMFNINTCTSPTLSLKFVDFLEIFLVNINFLASYINNIFLTFHKLFFHKIQNQYIVLNHFHWNLCKDQELHFTILSPVFSFPLSSPLYNSNTLCPLYA